MGTRFISTKSKKVWGRERPTVSPSPIFMPDGKEVWPQHIYGNTFYFNKVQKKNGGGRDRRSLPPPFFWDFVKIKRKVSVGTAKSKKKKGRERPQTVSPSPSWVGVGFLAFLLTSFLFFSLASSIILPPGFPIRATLTAAAVFCKYALSLDCDQVTTLSRL